MALNAHARSGTNRLVAPIARGLARLGFTANGLTTAGLLITAGAAWVVIAVDARLGAVLLALGAVLDAFDGAVARLQGTDSTFGAFYDSVADRVSDAILLGTAAWIVRDSALLFGVAVVALAGAQITSYMRAKAESLGWNATVGVLERAERVIIIILGFATGLVALALWVLAIGAVITIAQRWVVVRRQVATDSTGSRRP